MQDSLFDPDEQGSNMRDRPAFARRSENNTVLYRVYIYLEGRHVQMVDNVVYELHPTVQPNQARVVRAPRNQRCKLEIMLWGTFEVNAVVTMRTGDVIKLSHYLTFDRDIHTSNTKFIPA